MSRPRLKKTRYSQSITGDFNPSNKMKSLLGCFVRVVTCAGSKQQFLKEFERGGKTYTGSIANQLQ